MIVHVLRKPVNGTLIQNLLQRGCGALNIENCRIVTSDNLNGGAYAQKGSERNDGWRMKRDQLAGTFNRPTGRWPANLLLDEKVAAVLDEQSGITKSTGGSGAASCGGMGKRVFGEYALDRNGQNAGGLGDEGGASRFFQQVEVK